jgi:nucleoside-diphosphate-sugar epimerase
VTGRRVLVTGASGFLGEAVRRSLEASGAQPVATDARPAPDVRAVDVCRPEHLDEVMSGVESVVHLAAMGVSDQGLVAGADADTARAVRVNVEGFVHVVQAAARHGARRVVWASSTTVYGPAAGYGPEPVDETAPLRPTTAYGATKAACEHLGAVLAARFGIPVVSLRLPMVYGPDRWYGGSQKPLVQLTEALRTGSPATVQAWSGDADWIHVADAADALTDLALVDASRSAYHVVGHRGSLAELASALVAAAGDPPSAVVEPMPGGAPDIPAIDDAALRHDTGFLPRFPDAAAGAASYLTPERTPS